MFITNIILILLYCLNLSFQTIKSGLFCDDQITEIYVYDEKLGYYRLLQSIENPVDCDNIDYADLDVDPGALIKFKCQHNGLQNFGGGWFLINNKCYCYDFNNTEGFEHYYHGIRLLWWILIMKFHVNIMLDF